MYKFPAINPNPVLSVANNGMIIYSNEASEPILKEWGVRLGEKLPSNIVDLVQRLISSNSSEKMEVKVGKRVYLLAYHPVPEEECLNIYGFDISEQKELEEKLRESQESERVRSDELAAVLDAVPAAVWITHDSQAFRLTGNRLSYDWLRLPMGSNMSKAAPEGERPKTYRMLKDGVEVPLANMPVRMAAAGTEIHDYEFDLVYPDGTMRHLLGNAKPLLDEKGNPQGAVSAFVDITERKKAEEALNKAYENLEVKVKERTDELEEAQRMAHIGNWVWDITTNKAYWSDELYQIFERSPHELAPSYDEYLSYVHPDDREDANNAHKEALNGKPFNMDHRIILANGEVRTIHIKTKVIFDEKNIPIKLKGTVQDITERKKVEEKIRYLANIVKSSKDAIVTVSLDNIVTSWNKGAEQIFGYAAEEILGKKVSILEPENLRGDIKQLVEKIKQGKKTKHYESSRLKKDGNIVIISGTLSPVLDISGKLTAVSVIARDITESKRTEESLKNFEIARKKEIHHRVKNNLQVISSLLDLQAEQFRNRKCIKDSEVMEAFRESQDRVTSMALIHEELYRGGETDRLDFSSYIKELADNLFLTYRVGNKDISLKIDLEEKAFFDIDIAIPLGIMINELVSNSFKYAFQGRDKGEIRIILRREECNNTSFILIISDNGIGIPENLDIANLDSLGLQLVTTLVEQLDGELELRRNGGTEFVIRITVGEENNKAGTV
ncbi:MAG TPA: PAS domain S-box protein [Methanosarcina sp.]|nr:PAS domain S-box protein [Methanosarcina sp.]